MIKPLKLDVTRSVLIDEVTDEEGCALCPIGWYWRYDGDRQSIGPYRTMDEAMSAATRGKS